VLPDTALTWAHELNVRTDGGAVEAPRPACHASRTDQRKRIPPSAPGPVVNFRDSLHVLACCRARVYPCPSRRHRDPSRRQSRRQTKWSRSPGAQVCSDRRPSRAVSSRSVTSCSLPARRRSCRSRTALSPALLRVQPLEPLGVEALVTSTIMARPSTAGCPAVLVWEQEGDSDPRVDSKSPRMAVTSSSRRPTCRRSSQTQRTSDSLAYVDTDQLPSLDSNPVTPEIVARPGALWVAAGGAWVVGLR
jgi:hypothetical protein